MEEEAPIPQEVVLPEAEATEGDPVPQEVSLQLDPELEALAERKRRVRELDAQIKADAEEYAQARGMKYEDLFAKSDAPMPEEVDLEEPPAEAPPTAPPVEAPKVTAQTAPATRKSREEVQSELSRQAPVRREESAPSAPAERPAPKPAASGGGGKGFDFDQVSGAPGRMWNAFTDKLRGGGARESAPAPKPSPAPQPTESPTPAGRELVGFNPNAPETSAEEIKAAAQRAKNQGVRADVLNEAEAMKIPPKNLQKAYDAMDQAGELPDDALAQSQFARGRGIPMAMPGRGPKPPRAATPSGGPVQGPRTPARLLEKPPGLREKPPASSGASSQPAAPQGPPPRVNLAPKPAAAPQEPPPRVNLAPKPAAAPPKPVVPSRDPDLARRINQASEAMKRGGMPRDLLKQVGEARNQAARPAPAPASAESPKVRSAFDRAKAARDDIEAARLGEGIDGPTPEAFRQGSRPSRARTTRSRLNTPEGQAAARADVFPPPATRYLAMPGARQPWQAPAPAPAPTAPARARKPKPAAAEKSAASPKPKETKGGKKGGKK